MANAKTVKTRILLRNDSAENWKKSKVVLSAGELAYDTTYHYIKIGDGKKTWNELDRISVDVEDINGLEDVLTAAFDAFANVSTENGYSRILNEPDGNGGGVKVEDISNHIRSFVGVNRPIDLSGPYGSLYVIDDSDVGARLKMFKDGFTYYKNTTNQTSFDPNYELLVRKDISSLGNVLRFRGPFTHISSDETPYDDLSAFYEKYAPLSAGDIAINTANSKEYLATVNLSGTAGVSSTYLPYSKISSEIIELGDEGLYATKTEVRNLIPNKEIKTDGVSSVITAITQDDMTIGIRHEEIQIDMDHVTELCDTFTNVSSALVGNDNDLSTADTICGAKNTAISVYNNLLGVSANTSVDNTIHGVKAYVDARLNATLDELILSGGTADPF